MKVAVLFATGYEEIEALSVVDVLRRAQIDTMMVGIEDEYVTSSRAITIKMDTTLNNLNKDTIDFLILPGGMPGVKNLYENNIVQEWVKDFDAQQKKIGAICAAPSILGRLGVLKGKCATCYPGFEQDLEGATLREERVVEDGHVITGIGAGASLEFAFKILEIIKGKDEADQIKMGMITNF
ncbi:MAG: DJ-1 family glyoxalase III [Cellulosilyticaceae bacterium]